MRYPSLQFYPGDWLRDSVSGCSLAAQGLWLRMLLLMHDSERYGYLCQNGQPIPSEQIARRCGCSRDEYVTLLAELESAGVPSRSQDDIIYSRRMVRDAADRAKATARKRKERSHADVTPSVTPESHSSHAPSSSSSSVSKKKQAGANAPDAFTPLEYLEYLARQPAYAHVDPVVELSRIEVWHARAENRERRITKRFLERWVGRIERPLALVPSSPKESRAEKELRLQSQMMGVAHG